MKSIGNFFGRLTSRKFILTVTGIVAVTLYPEAATQIVALIVAFVGAEGAADAVSRYAVTQEVVKESELANNKKFLETAFAETATEEDDLDLTNVTPGEYPL